MDLVTGADVREHVNQQAFFRYIDYSEDILCVCSDTIAYIVSYLEPNWITPTRLFCVAMWKKQS
jgi:hypothetical protein